jgi:hypothetical protein
VKREAAVGDRLFPHQQGSDVGAQRPGLRGGRGRPARQGYRQRSCAGPERQARREHGRRDRGGVAELHGRAPHQDDNKLAALVVLGKYLGMFDERPQNSNVIYAISDEPMSAEEWKKQFVKAG